jgi:hypothetical protein
MYCWDVDDTETHLQMFPGDRGEIEIGPKAPCVDGGRGSGEPATSALHACSVSRGVAIASFLTGPTPQLAGFPSAESSGP